MDENFVLDFRTCLTTEAKSKLKKKLSSNTGHSYFNKIRSTLTHAFDRGFITKIHLIW